MGEADVLLVLAPAGDEEHVEDAAFPPQQRRFAHGRGFGSGIRRIEEEEVVVLEVGGREPVRDQDDLAIRSVRVGEQPPRQAEGVLDVREVRWEVLLGDVRIRHVRPEPDHGIVDGHRLWQQVHEVASGHHPGDAVHLHEVEAIAGILAANQPLEGEGHLLAGHVLPAPAHRSGHVHDHDRRALGGRPGPVDLEVLAPERGVGRFAAGGRLSGHAVQDRCRQVEPRDRVAELPGAGRREFVGAIVVVDRVMPPVPPSLHRIEDGGEQGLLVLPHRRGTERPAVPVLDQPFSFRGLPEEFFGAATDLGEVLEVRLLHELPKFLEVHDHGLRVPQGLLQLLEQAVDGFQFVADLEGFLDRGDPATAKGPAIAEAFDAILIPHRLHDSGDLAADGGVTVQEVPQSFEPVDLPFPDLPGQSAANAVFEAFIGQNRAGEFVDGRGGVDGGRRRVPGREDLVLAGFQSREDRVDRRSESRERLGWESDRLREFLGREATSSPGRDHLVPEAAEPIRGWRGRRRERRGVVAPIRVEHTAQRRARISVGGVAHSPDS